VTPDELTPLIHEYRAGLEAELKLLYHLKKLADDQRAASQAQALDRLVDFTDERDAVMANLVTLEHELRPTRDALAAAREVAQSLPDFQEVARLHGAAADLVYGIGTSDQETMGALRDAELARRLASHAIEMGEATLAAYRRVLAPSVTSASLIDTRG